MTKAEHLESRRITDAAASEKRSELVYFDFVAHARAALPAYQQALEEAMELIRSWASQGDSSGEPCTCCWCIPHHANCTAANLLKRWDGDDGTGTNER